MTKNITILPLLRPINNIIEIINNISSEPKNLFLENSNIAISTQNVLHNFLKEYKDSTETLKIYSKELERLILWCKNIINIDILALTRENIVEYQLFLKNPTPKELWCGDKAPKLLKTGIINEKWRVFHKNLSNTSIKKILKIMILFLII